MKRRYSIRLIINAILYVNKTGIQWRMLPNDFPDWKLVYYYFRKWAQDATTEKIHHIMLLQIRMNLGKYSSLSPVLIDYQSVKTTSVTDFKGFDGNKKVEGRKRFIITDTLSFIISLVITQGNIGERAGAKLAIEKLGNRFVRLTKILADQGFDGVEFITQIKEGFNIVLEVVAQVLSIKGFQVIPKRWMVAAMELKKLLDGLPFIEDLLKTMRLMCLTLRHLSIGL